MRVGVDSCMSGKTTIFVCLAILSAMSASGQSFTIHTPAGDVEVPVSHVGPGGNLVSPPAPEPASFRPPSIFSAPLPSGSGARALGLAGAFTALADDATAASWNPAGLIQLERPEASAVLRLKLDRADHHSSDDGFRVGSDHYDSEGLNYFSVAYPFEIGAIQRNAVVSLNYQEAYDFTQHFTADLSETSRARAGDATTATYQGTETAVIHDDIANITVNSHLTTVTSSQYDQLLKAGVQSDVDFEQEGVLSAITPAMALEITPKIAIGAAFNWYMIDPLSGDSIRSRTHAGYKGTSVSDVGITTKHTTSGTYDYSGTVTIPAGGGVPIPIPTPVGGGGVIPAFSDTSGSSRREAISVDGEYTEINEFTDLDGHNFTLGALVTVNRLLSLGASVDLPWTAEARQTRTVVNTRTTYDASHTKVLDVSESETVESKNVEFNFPLFWSIGAVLRWTPEFYTTFDVGQTLWSDFSFKADGEPRLNPLDGSPHGDHPLDDTWAYRAGAEYLVVLKKTEIPIRCGFAREERPALDKPDVFYTASLGSGISVGKDPGRILVDVAYSYTWANNVSGIVPEQTGLKSDVAEHQMYVSLIKHF